MFFVESLQIHPDLLCRPLSIKISGWFDVEMSHFAKQRQRLRRFCKDNSLHTKRRLPLLSHYVEEQLVFPGYIWPCRFVAEQNFVISTFSGKYLDRRRVKTVEATRVTRLPTVKAQCRTKKRRHFLRLSERHPGQVLLDAFSVECYIPLRRFRSPSPPSPQHRSSWLFEIDVFVCVWYQSL